MKKISCILILLMGLLIQPSCNKNNPDEPTTPDQPEKEMELLNSGNLNSSEAVQAAGGEFLLKFYTASEWTAKISPADLQWINIDKNQGPEGENELCIRTDKNDSDKDREAEVIIENADAERLSVVILQHCSALDAKAPEFPINCLGGEVRVSVTQKENVKADLKDASWIKAQGFSGNDYVFIVSENTEAKERTAEIDLVNTVSGDKATVTISQDACIDWVKEEFYRRSLMMKFSGTWCSACPSFSTSIEQAQKAYPDRILTYTVYDAQSEKDIRFVPTDIFNYYNGYITSFPTGIQDGRASFGNAVPYEGIVDLAKEAVEKLPAKCTADIVSSLSGNELQVDLKVYCKQADRYKVAIALVENGYECKQNFPSGYDMHFIHNHVLRGFLTAEEGDELLMEHSGTRDLSYRYTIPNKVSNVENCELILYFISPIEKNSTDLNYSDMKILKLKEYVDNAIGFSLNDNLEHK